MIEKITKNILNKLVNQIKEKENKIIIVNDILKPLFNEIIDLIYPYVKILFILYILNIIIMIIILFIIIKLKYKL